MEYDLYQDFKVLSHVKKYFNYCEVIIDRLGKIRYATPSHQIMMLCMYGVKIGLLDESILKPENVYDRHIMSQKVYDKIPKYQMFTDFLIEELKCVCVYTTCYSGPKKINKRQELQLNKLQKHGACNFKNNNQF